MSLVQNVGELKVILAKFPDDMKIGLADWLGNLTWLDENDISVREHCRGGPFLALANIPEPEDEDDL